MKKIILFALVASLMSVPEVSASTAKEQTSINDADKFGRRSKSGKFSRKKGFLWGLFGKKKQCDCPN